MAKVDVIAETNSVETYVNPYGVKASEFAAASANVDMFYVGDNYTLEIPGNLPDVAWYAAHYAEKYDFDIVSAVFKHFKFDDGKNLLSMPGLEPVLNRVRVYNPEDLVWSYMDHHDVPEIVQATVDTDSLYDAIVGDREISTHPFMVLWQEGDEALTDGWG